MDQQAHSQRISPLALIGLLSFLVGISVAIYYASLSYGFYFDDHPNITKVFGVRHRHFLDVFFQSSRWISLWINTLYYRIANFNPFVYRLGNLVIHVANGLLVFWIFSLLFKNLKDESFLKQHATATAFALAGLFLFHPVATQTVCYVIQGQLEGLSTVASLIMILFFWYCVNAQSLVSRLFFGALLCCVAALAVGTKEIVVVAPFLIILVDWFFIAQGESSTIKKHSVLYMIVFAIFFSSFLYTYGVEHFLTLIKLKLEPISTHGNVLTTHRDISIAAFPFLCSQFKVILHYIAIYFWPFGISVDYDWKLTDSFWEIDCIIPFLILIVFGLWLLFRLLKNHTDKFVFAWLWFFLCMVPRASVIPSSELIADYKTYCASIGILMIIAWVLVRCSQWIANKCARPVLIFWVSLVCLLLPWAGVAYRRTQIWQSQEALWRDIVLHAPTKPRAWNNLAVALIDGQKYSEAIPMLQKAISLDRFYPDPWNNLSVAYAQLGNINKAISALETLITLNSDHIEGYNNLATFLITKKQYKDAELLLRQALVRRPYYGKALFNLGRIYYLQGKMKEAQYYFKLCCTKADMDTVMGYSSWGMACMREKDYAEALVAYSKAVELDPKDDELKRHLAYAHLFNKQYDESEKIFKDLYERNPRDVQILLGLAELYVVSNRFAKALELYKKVESCGSQLPMIFLRAAGCAYKLKDFELAGTYLRRYLNTHPPQDSVAQIQSILKALERKDFSKKSWAWLN